MIEYAASHDFDRIILIQATSPLITSDDLTAGLRLLESSGADSLLSGVEQKRFIWSRSSDGVGSPQNYDPLHRPRRQDFSPYFVENGAFYICSKADLLRTGCRLSGKIALHAMPEETFYELDESVDWAIIEQLLISRGGREDRKEPLPQLGALCVPSAKLSSIKLVVSDVDGVLTDSGMYYSDAGDESKKFNTRDGKGFELLRNAGIQTAIITSENTRIVERRAAKMKIDFLYQGAIDKTAAFDDLLRRTGLSPHEIAFIGDDLADIPILRRVGFAACPQDAIPEAVAIAHFRTKASGGRGVVREIAELILETRCSQSHA
jgi:N-acylneuraminate cytidylyltransferase